MTELIKKNIVMDATLLTSLMNCPRFSDFSFNLNLQSMGGKSNSMECGSIVHKVVEVYNKSKIAGLNRNDAIAYGMAAGQLYIAGCKYCTGFVPSHMTEDEHSCEDKQCILKPQCGHPINEYPGIKNTPQTSDKAYLVGWQWALDTCEQYLEYYKNDSWVPLEAEVVKSKILYEDDEIRILWKAKLDLLVDTNEAILPVDHKTMKQNRKNVSLNNQFMGQCLVTDNRKMVVNKIGFQTTLKPQDKFVREIVSYSAARLTEWQSETLPFYGKLLIMYNEMNHWPPNYSNCNGKFGLCKYTDVCESDPNMREEVLKANFYVGPVWNPTNDED